MNHLVEFYMMWKMSMTKCRWWSVCRLVKQIHSLQCTCHAYAHPYSLSTHNTYAAVVVSIMSTTTWPFEITSTYWCTVSHSIRYNNRAMLLLWRFLLTSHTVRAGVLWVNIVSWDLLCLTRPLPSHREVIIQTKKWTIDKAILALRGREEVSSRVREE